MKKEEILNKLRQIKPKLIEDGFIIDGLFGSYARDENNDNSDVDILYHLEDSFLNNNRGFIGFKKLDEIKSFISKDIGLKVDFAPKNNLSKTAQKYILKDVIYV
jgi:predicted nucleotidyltransferase